MTLQQIHYALTIEECGSMNKASEKLFIVQPTLTNAMQELEHEVGFSTQMGAPRLYRRWVLNQT